MSQRVALFLSAIITVCILASVGITSLGFQAVAAINAPEASASDSVAVAEAAVADAAPASVATEPMALATATTVADIPTATAAPEPTAAYKVSPDQAAAIALNTAPGAVISGSAELVSFQGAIAYEVTLNTGKIYVDANSGQVLYNSVAAAAPAGPVDENQAVQIASAYMKDNGSAAEAVGIRFGRSRKFPGMQLFEVTFADETRVYVNADTGEIVQAIAPRNSEDHEGSEDHD